VLTRVYVDGEISAPEDARVHVFDHGFLFGDSVYEVFWWHHGVLIQEEAHLDRLEASARRLYMDIEFTRPALVAAVQETVRAAGAAPGDDAYVRLVVTRGTGPLGLDFRGVPHRSLIIIVAPASRPSEEAVARGLSVALVGRRRMSAHALDPRAKTGNYLNNVLALHEARLAGADDAIMLNDAGEVTEATTANVYVIRAGVLTTPPLDAGILCGTTRIRVLALCAEAGIVACEAALHPDDLRAADEIFLSSSVRGLLPIRSIDGEAVRPEKAASALGPVTRDLRERFEAAAAAEAAAARA